MVERDEVEREGVGLGWVMVVGRKKEEGKW